MKKLKAQSNQNSGGLVFAMKYFLWSVWYSIVKPTLDDPNKLTQFIWKHMPKDFMPEVEHVMLGLTNENISAADKKKLLIDWMDSYIIEYFPDLVVSFYQAIDRTVRDVFLASLVKHAEKSLMARGWIEKTSTRQIKPITEDAKQVADEYKDAATSN